MDCNKYEVNWLRSYQCSKKQQVYVNSLFNLIFILSYLFWHTSRFHTRTFSFLVCNSTPYFCSRLYADKTSLAASGSNLDILLNDINSPLHAVYEWLCSNKLTLSKTNYIIFFTSAKEKSKFISTFKNSKYLLTAISNNYQVPGCLYTLSSNLE